RVAHDAGSARALLVRVPEQRAVPSIQARLNVGEAVDQAPEAAAKERQGGGALRQDAKKWTWSSRGDGAPGRIQLGELILGQRSRWWVRRELSQIQEAERRDLEASHRLAGELDHPEA